MIGRHSVMLRPDSVRRVMPPTTMTAMTSVEDIKSQFATAGGEITGSWAGAGSAPFDEKKRGSSGTDFLGRSVSPGGLFLGNPANECSRVRERSARIDVRLGLPRRRWCNPRWRRDRQPGMDRFVALFGVGERRRARESSPEHNIPSVNTPSQLREQASKQEQEQEQEHRHGRAGVLGWHVSVSLLTVTAMLSTIIRRALPSLRQARPYTAAAHTQAAASPSKLDEGEQAIYDKLSGRFQTSDLLVQDISGACPTSASSASHVLGDFLGEKDSLSIFI